MLLSQPSAGQWTATPNRPANPRLLNVPRKAKLQILPGHSSIPSLIGVDITSICVVEGKNIGASSLALPLLPHKGPDTTRMWPLLSETSLKLLAAKTPADLDDPGTLGS